MAFNPKIAIDLGTANSLVYVTGKGIVLNEPTVVAITLDDRKILAVGNEAKKMLGRTPETIKASRPMRDGVIADYKITAAMLRYFLQKSLGGIQLLKPDVMVSVPAGVTSVEARAVLEATYAAGARNAYLIPEPLAAAIGAGLPIAAPRGNMIVNLGGGTTEVAVISLGGIVVSGSVRVAGNKLDEAVAAHLRRRYNLLVGEQTAEAIKIQIGRAVRPTQPTVMEVKGRDIVRGLPQVRKITAEEIFEVLQAPLGQIAQAVKSVLSQTPPELASDVVDAGVVLSGGTAQLDGLERYITDSTGLPTHLAEDPLFCVVRGIGTALENLPAFEKGVIRK